MVYAAWSDKVLSPSEVAIIKNKAKGLQFLTSSDLLVLDNWTNPLSPPTLHQLKYWESLLVETANEQDQNNCLTSLGIELAEKAASTDVSSSTDWKDPKVFNQLKVLEAHLKSVSFDAHMKIFPNSPVARILALPSLPKVKF